MSKININNVTYPKDNTSTQICINNYKLSNTTIDLQKKKEANNINTDLSFNYIDYTIPGNIFELSSTSLKLNNTNIPYAFSDVVSLCKLQTDILAQLFYVPTAWDSTTIYNINTIVSYTINDLTYTFMSIIDNTSTKIKGRQPNLFYNYWQLQEYSSVGMASISAPTTEVYPYPVGYQVYYNQNYYDASSSNPIATPSKRGIYTCNTPTWTENTSYNTGALVYYTPPGELLMLYISTIDNNTTTPGTLGSSSWEFTVDNPQPPIIRNSSNVLSFNTTYWTLQIWDANAGITYNKNYIVYYTPSEGSQTLYISLVDNNNTTPGSTSWATTTL
jgi:hypothetical protein